MAYIQEGVVSSVTITLSSDGDFHDTLLFPDRRIKLTRENPTFSIGRSSKVQSKGFVASLETGWFDNQVMSRKHAEITVNLDSKKLTIQDTGSMHGTYLNGSKERLHKGEPAELKDGDMLKFGIPVWRGDETFAPTTVKVGIKFGDSIPLGGESATSEYIFKVPDGSDISDSDENSIKGDEVEILDAVPSPSRHRLPGSLSSDPIDLTQTPVLQGNLARPVIDMTSSVPSCSPGPATVVVTSDAVSSDASSSEVQVTTVRISSPDLGSSVAILNDVTNSLNDETTFTIHDIDYFDDEDMDEEYPPTSSDYDGSSILLTSDEENEYASESDIDGSQVSDGPYSGSGYPSELEISDLESSIEVDEDFEDEFQREMEWEADHFSDEEAYDEQEELDELSNWENKAVPATASSFQSSQPDLSLVNSSAASRKFPTTVSIATGEASQVEAAKLETSGSAPANKDLPATAVESLDNARIPDAGPSEPAPSMVAASTPVCRDRMPSPSDAALAKSVAFSEKSGRRTTASTASTALGAKSGKFEYFLAREHNKGRFAGISCAPADTTGLYSATASGGSLPSAGPSTTADPSTNADPSSAAGPFFWAMKTSMDRLSTIQPLAHSPWLVNGDRFLNCHLPMAQDISFGDSQYDDETMTSAFTFQKHKETLETIPPLEPVQAPLRTHLGISDIVDGCQPIQSEPKSKGKRKADEISTHAADQAEKQNETDAKEQGDAAATQSAAPTTSVDPPSLITPSTTPDLATAPRQAVTFSPDLPALPQLLLGDAAVENQVTRPVKRRRLRKFAERVGYAALGGVTVGAMVVGSLIYTAPTF